MTVSYSGVMAHEQVCWPEETLGLQQAVITNHKEVGTTAINAPVCVDVISGQRILTKEMFFCHIQTYTHILSQLF